MEETSPRVILKIFKDLIAHKPFTSWTFHVGFSFASSDPLTSFAFLSLKRVNFQISDLTEISEVFEWLTYNYAKDMPYFCFVKIDYFSIG